MCLYIIPWIIYKGELSAVTFKVGCYIVHSALRVYTIHDQDWYLPEPEKPAGEEDVATVKKDLRWNEREGKIIGADGSIFADIFCVYIRSLWY